MSADLEGKRWQVWATWPDRKVTLFGSYVTENIALLVASRLTVTIAQSAEVVDRDDDARGRS